MGRFQFVSPGAMAGASAREILTQQREEARRKLLDEMAIKNSESQRAAQAVQTEGGRIRNEGELLDQTVPYQAAGEAVPDTIDPKILKIMQDRAMLGGKPAGTTPSVTAQESYSLPPDVAAEGVTIEPGQSQSAPQTPIPPQSQAAPAEAKQNYFRGTKADRTDAEKQQAAGEVLAALMDPNTTPAQAQGLLIKASASGITLPAGIAQSLQPRSQIMMNDYEKGGSLVPQFGPDGKPVLAGPGDPSIINRPYRPRAPQPPTPHFSYAGVDKDGNPITLNSITGGFSSPGPIGAKPSASGSGANKNSKIPAALQTNLNNLRQKAQSGLAKDRGAEAGYQQAQDGIISQYTKSGDVRDTVRDALAHEDPSTPTSDIIQKAIAEQWFDNAKELEEFADLLSVVRGS